MTFKVSVRLLVSVVITAGVIATTCVMQTAPNGGGGGSGLVDAPVAAEVAHRAALLRTIKANELLAQVRGTVHTSAEWQQALILTLDGPAATSTVKPNLGKRSDFGRLLVEQKYTRGAEVGVQRGLFSREVLAEWAGHGLDLHVLIDVWAPQKNYIDIANVDASQQESILEEAQRNLVPYKDHTLFLRMYSVEAVRWFEPHSLDFVYIDARHDYCGVMEDLQAYWPLIRPGGMLAGHDYVTNPEMIALSPRTKMDWSVCSNGTIHQGAVKGAVDDFVASVGVRIDAIGVTAEDWRSFYLIKPVRTTK